MSWWNLNYFVILAREAIKEESSKKSLESAYLSLSKGTAIATDVLVNFSVYLLLRGKDKPTFSDSSWKQCEERLAEFADTRI